MDQSDLTYEIVYHKITDLITKKLVQGRGEYPRVIL